MTTITPGLPDFDRSFLTFSVPDGRNTARIQIDSRCVVVEAGGEKEFVLITPCKSEVMYVESGLFADPNYDFSGVFSRDEYLLLRTWPCHDPENTGEWDAGASADRFDSTSLSVVELPANSVERLSTSKDVVEATLAGHPIIARTRLQGPGDAEATVDYQVKTMNVREKTGDFQVDTGPVLVPSWVRGEDPIRRGGRAVEGFDMAFACYNTFTGGELVLREPTASNGGQVWHYSRIVTVDASHELFAITSD